MQRMNRNMHFLWVFCLGLLSTSSWLPADVWNMPPTQFSDLAGMGGTSNSSDLAVSPSGNAFAIWSNNIVDDVGTQVSVFSNNAWGVPQLISTSGFSASSTKIATDNTGTALAIWSEDFPGEIKTSYYNGTTWVTPSPDPLDLVAQFADPFASIAMNGSGGGIAMWIDANTSNVRSSTFSSPSWSAPTTIGTGTGVTSIAYSSNGTAVAEWDDGGVINVANYIGGVWQLPIPVGSTFSAPLEVGIDSSGKVIASWLDILGNVVISYFNGSLWSLPQTISTSAGNTDLSLAMAGNGTAVLAWIDGANDGFSSSFNGTSWSSPIPFATGVANIISGFGPGNSLSVALDTTGNALIEWASVAGDIRSARLPLGGTAWLDESIIDPDLPMGIIDINAGLADNGRGFSVWGERNSSESAQTFGSFTLLFPAPPLSIDGRSCDNKFATQTDRIHIISWVPSPSTDPAIVAYNLRRNGILIATLPASGPFVFFDHHRCRKVYDLYTVTSVAANGFESNPLAIVLN